jgi:hypothetical protein
MGKDYYAILGVSKTADADEMKKGGASGSAHRQCSIRAANAEPLLSVMRHWCNAAL